MCVFFLVHMCLRIVLSVIAGAVQGLCFLAVV